jgi:hypothetical protein
MPEQADGKPQDWANIKILEVEIEPPAEKSMVVTRKVTYAKVGIRGWFRETVSPIYVPDRSEDKATDSSAAMTAFQKHWDESATQARTTGQVDCHSPRRRSRHPRRYGSFDRAER